MKLAIFPKALKGPLFNGPMQIPSGAEEGELRGTHSPPYGHHAPNRLEQFWQPLGLCAPVGAYAATAIHEILMSHHEPMLQTYRFNGFSNHNPKLGNHDINPWECRLSTWPI